MTCLHTQTSYSLEFLSIKTSVKINYEYCLLYTSVAEEDRIPVKAIVTNDEGKEQAQYEIPVASLDTPLAFGSFSANKQVWYARTMTFKADTLTPVAQDPAPVDPVEPEDPKNDSDQTSQDNGTTDTNVPKTGDNMGLGLMMLLVVGGAGSAAVFYRCV